MDQKVIDALKEVHNPRMDSKLEAKPVNPGFLWKLINLDPVLWRGFVIAIVALLGSFGLVIADSKVNAIIGAFVAASALIQAVWTRDAVVPNEKVVVYKPDPVEQPTVVAPGPAVSTDVVAVANSAAGLPDVVVRPANLPFPSAATDWRPNE